jgi:hypothetical protein
MQNLCVYGAMPGATSQTFLEKIVANAQSAATNLRVKSALNPMLWLCGIVSLPCFLLSYWAHGLEPLATTLVYVGSVPIVGTVVGFLYLMVAAPEKLQSEDYQIRHETLELIKQKGSSVEILPSSLTAITNPAHPLPAIEDQS